MRNSGLAKEYTSFLLNLCNEVKKETEGEYNPMKFRGLAAAQGGVWATLRVILGKEHDLGCARMWEFGRLDLSVEAQLLAHDKFHSLFKEVVLDICKDRLGEYDYSAASASDSSVV